MSELRSIITRADGRVLLHARALPSTELTDFSTAAACLSRILNDEEVVPLHQDSRYTHPEDSTQQIWVFEMLEPERIPVNWQWCGPEALELVTDEPQRAALEAHFAELVTPPAHRQAWQRTGWLKRARTWVQQHLPGSTPLLVRQNWHGAFWGSSSLHGRRLYFKALPAALQREVSLVPWLRRFSSAIPETAAVNQAEGWLITWDAGDTALIRDADPRHWQRSLRALAELQRSTQAHHATLERLGCSVMTPEAACSETRGFLEQSALPQASQVLRQLEGIAASLERLGDTGLPLALCHGDFHAMNVISPDIIIDWSDAMIAHPFTDLERFLRWIMGGSKPHHWSPFADTRAIEPDLVRAYLEPWADVATLAQLTTSFYATRPVGVVCSLAQHLRLERQSGLSLQRSLITSFLRQLEAASSSA